MELTGREVSFVKQGFEDILGACGSIDTVTDQEAGLEFEPITRRQPSELENEMEQDELCAARREVLSKQGGGCTKEISPYFTICLHFGPSLTPSFSAIARK